MAQYNQSEITTFWKSMASISIHQLDERLRERLQQRANEHQRTLEAEILDILQTAVFSEGSPQNLTEAIAQHFQEFGAFEIPLPPREKIRDVLLP